MQGSEILAWLCFGFVLLLTFGGALIAVIPKNLVHNISGLIACLAGVAGLYVFLNSGFLAVMQLLIYVGAICVAIVFAIMLSEPMRRNYPPRETVKVTLSFLISLMVVIIVGFVLVNTAFPPSAATSTADWSIKHIGQLLYTRFELIFELISIVLVAAIIGAIITAAPFRPWTESGKDVEGGSK